MQDRRVRRGRSRAPRGRRACRRVSCRTRRTRSRRRFRAPTVRAATPPAARAPTARTTRAARRTRSRGTNAASTTMPSGSSTTHVALERDREVHLAAHAPTHVGRVRPYLVERPAPLAHVQAVSSSTSRVRPASRSASSASITPPGVLQSSMPPPPQIAHEQHAVGRLEQPSGDRPLVHGRHSRASASLTDRAGTIDPMPEGACRPTHARAPEPAPPGALGVRCSSLISLVGRARRPDRLQPRRDDLSRHADARPSSCSSRSAASTRTCRRVR